MESKVLGCHFASFSYMKKICQMTTQERSEKSKKKNSKFFPEFFEKKSFAIFWPENM